MGLKITQSENLFSRSKKVIPGGVNSPLRAFKTVGGTPVFFSLGVGSKIFDEDQHQYIDYVGAWGPAILGHANAQVIDAVQKQIEQGFGFGAPHCLELEISELIVQMIPSIEKLRLLNSGTEAAMTAIRLARGMSGKDKIIKFSGCYHGHVDALLVSAGSGVATLGIPGTPGIPDNVANQTIVLPFNDENALENAFKHYGDDLAAVIVEPIAGNMNFIRPSQSFLKICIDVCAKSGALLIADEVMSGFRVHSAGAQGLLGFEADLTVLGKVIGGGMPIGAVGGKAKYMDGLAPCGPVYQAGTLSGNPVAVRAGLETLRVIRHCDGFYEKLNDYLNQLICGIERISKRLGFPIAVDGEGGMFGFLLGMEKMPDQFGDLKKVDQKLFASFFHEMLSQGVYLAPSVYECCFLSFAHTQKDLDLTLACFEKALINVLVNR